MIFSFLSNFLKLLPESKDRKDKGMNEYFTSALSKETKKFKVPVNTKENYIIMVTDGNNSPSLGNESIFKELSDIKFYYQDLAGLLDSNYLKSCSYLLNAAIYSYKSELSTSVEGHKENIKNKYLSWLNKDLRISEIQSSYFGTHTSYPAASIGNTPSASFEKKIIGEPLEDLFSGLLIKIIYFSIFDTNDKNLFKYETVSRKTLSQFESFDENTMTSAESVSDYEAIVNFKKDLYKIVKEIFNKLMGEKVTRVSAVINNTEYTIAIKENNTEKGELENLIKNYKDAKIKYKNLLLENKEKEAEDVEKSILTNYYVLPDNVEASMNTIENPLTEDPYFAFPTKFIYHAIYELKAANSLVRPKTLRGMNYIELNLSSSSADYNNEVRETIKEKINSEPEIHDIIHNFMISAKDNVFFPREIVEDVKCELEKIREEVKNETKTDNGCGYFSLDLIDEKFKKKLYTVEETKIFAAISRYWRISYGKYKQLLEQSKNETASLLRSTVLGEKIEQKDIGDFIIEIEDLKNDESLTGDGRVDLGVIAEASDISDKKITINKKPWNLELKYIGEKPETNLLYLNHFHLYKVAELYTYFCFYEYDPERVNTSVSFFKTTRTATFPEQPIGRRPDIGLDIFGFLEELKKDIERVLDAILDTTSSTEGGVPELLEEVEEANVAKELLNQKEAGILSSRGVEVEDFYYVDKKYMPIGKNIDVEFFAYNDSETGKPTFMSVSKRFGEIKEFSETGLYEDNYFESMILKDEGGFKEIELTLKSVDDINLERIIYNSLIEPINAYNKQFSDEINMSGVLDLIKYKNVNFRVKFGYSDIYSNAIDASSILDLSYRNRTEKTIEGGVSTVKPVKSSPWINFFIKDIETKILGEQNYFVIKGISLGEEMLDGFSIFSENQGLIKSQDPTPLEGISQVAGLLLEASNGKICIIGDENKVITGYNNNPREVIQRSIKFNEEDTIINGVLNEIPEGWIFGAKTNSSESQETIRQRNNLSLRRTGSTEDEYSIKEILDVVAKWLPEKTYLVSKNTNHAEPYNKSIHGNFATKKEYKDEFYLVSLSADYEIIEAEAKIDGDDYGGMENKVLIRFIYRGPKDDESRYAVRMYSFRNKQNTVVKNFTIENEININNVRDYCSIVGSEYKYILTSKYLENSLEASNYPRPSEMKKIAQEENSKKSVIVPKKNYISFSESIVTDSSKEESKKAIEKALSSVANSHINKLSMWPFEGELEILGDPYYLFDDKLGRDVHLIYIEANRANKMAQTSGGYISRSYYTGLYLIREIEHELTSDGVFVTRLKVIKDITRQ